MSGQFGRIKNDFSRAEAYAKQAAIREIHYVETLHWKKALVIFFIGFFLGFAVSNFARASGMTANANYNPANVTITGGTIGGTSVANVAAAGTAFINQDPVYGETMVGGAGSAYDFSFINKALTLAYFRIPTGTQDVDFFGGVNATNYLSLNGKMIMSATAPTITSGFGTSPSISFSNGTATVIITIGTGGTAYNGTLTFPAAPNGWSCIPSQYGNSLVNGTVTLQSYIPSKTNVELDNLALATATLTAWGAGTNIMLHCLPY